MLGAENGQIIKYNGVTEKWESVDESISNDNWGNQVVQKTTRLTGDGTSSNPLDIASQGASNGQVLKYDASNGTWKPSDDNIGNTNVQTTTPLTGNGTSGDKIRLQNGTTEGQSLEWTGSAWAAGGEHAFVKQGADQLNNVRGSRFFVSNINELTVPATGTYLIMASARVFGMQGEDNYASLEVTKNNLELFSNVLVLAEYSNSITMGDINGTIWDIQDLASGDKLRLKASVAGTGTVNYTVNGGKIIIMRLD